MICSGLAALQSPRSGQEFLGAHLLLFACSRLPFENAGVHGFHVLHQQPKKLVIKAEHQLWKEKKNALKKAKKDSDKTSKI